MFTAAEVAPGFTQYVWTITYEELLAVGGSDVYTLQVCDVPLLCSQGTVAVEIATADSDGDGLSDAEETTYGTDPNDADSTMRE